METRVIGKFRVEGSGHRSSLANSYGIGSLGGENFDAFTHVRDLRSADENHLERHFFQFALKISDELSFANRAIDLTPVCIATDSDVERTQSGLGGVLNLGGQQDRSGAGAEGRLRAHKIPELLETLLSKKLQKCPRLASRNHKAIDVVELLRFSNQDYLGTEFFKAAAVGVEIPLQR